MKLTAIKKKKVYVPEDPDKAWVEIVYLKPGQRAAIETDSNTVTATRVGEVMQSKMDFDRTKKRQLFFEALIFDWGGFDDQHSSPLPCVLPSFELVQKETGEFYSWLQEESEKFIKEVQEQEKVAEGN